MHGKGRSKVMCDNWLVRQLVLPEADDTPASFLEIVAHFPVPGHVLGDLLTPVGLIGLWYSHVPRATMPETSVNEHGQTVSWECKIGRAGNREMSAPTGDVVLFEYGDEATLGFLVAPGTDRPHDLGPFRFCEHVSHGVIPLPWSCRFSSAS